MFQKHKYLIIGIALLAAASAMLFLFRKKIFPAKDVADSVGTDNTNLETNTQPAATVPATIRINIKPGDPVYSTVDQDVQRVKIWGGFYHTFDEKTGIPYGTGSVTAGKLIGTMVKSNNAGGFYVKAAAGLSYPYYLVEQSKVYTK